MKKQQLLLEAVKYVTGNKKSMKIKGKSREMLAFKKVLNASKRLYENLQRENVRLKEIEKLVAQKNKAAKEFKQITGKAWPL